MAQGAGRRLAVAGLTSGAGKTTVTCALLAAWHRSGYAVQPFKIGPDYIDPGYHTCAAGRRSRTLDSVLLPPGTLQSLFYRAAASADVSVVEGMMGLFDGRNGLDDAGSTAHIAKLLATPVVIVLDVSATSRSAGAMALGCTQFDPDLHVAGFILNKVGGPVHAQWATEAVEAATGLPVFGAIPHDAALALPERHLGLVPSSEQQLDTAHLDRLADAAERFLALDRLYEAAQAGPCPAPAQDDLFPSARVEQHVTIAIAQDRAFTFYYEDSLDLLRARGALLIPFSPLADQALPAGTQGVLIGGGFPEVFAADLAANTAMHAALREAAQRNLPIYGECGGLMYLGRTLTDGEGHRHTMAGVIPLDSTMEQMRMAMGYRSVRAVRDSILLPRGTVAGGHEFHYSRLVDAVPAATAAYEVIEQEGRHEGYAQGNILASYIHVHFGSDPAMADRFIAACHPHGNHVSRRRPDTGAKSPSVVSSVKS